MPPLASLARRLDPFPGPAGWRVKAVLANEAFERFAYYSSRSLLALFLTDRLGFDEPAAVSAYAYYVAGCYLSPLVGGYIGDVLWGRFRTIVVFNIVYMAGLLTVGLTAFTDSRAGCLAGLALMALGTGGIKPHAGPFGAEQRASGGGGAGGGEGDGSDGGEAENRRFWMCWYMAINIGSVSAYVVAPAVRDAAGYGPAYLTSAGALVLSLAIFLAPARSYVHSPPARASVYATLGRVLRAAAGLRVGRGGGGGGEAGGDSAGVELPSSSGGALGRSRGTERTPLIGKGAAAAAAGGFAPAVAGGTAAGGGGELLPALSLGDSALPPGGVGDGPDDGGAPSPGAGAPDGPLSPPLTGAPGGGGGGGGFVPHTPSSIVGRKTPGSKGASGGARGWRSPAAAASCCSCIDLDRARAAGVPAEEVAGVRAFLGLIPLFACVVVFWMLYDTQDSLWTLQRRHMDLRVGGVTLAPEVFGILNPLLVIVGVPLMDRVFLPALARMGVAPTPLRRMAFGMQAAAASFACTAAVQARIDAAGDGSVPVAWQLPQFVVMNAAELCVSATGLEFCYSQAPPSMRGTVMALFFMTTFVGNAINGAVYPAAAAVLTPVQLLGAMAALMAAAGGVFAVLAWRYVPVDPRAWGGGPAGAGGGGGTPPEEQP